MSKLDDALADLLAARSEVQAAQAAAKAAETEVAQLTRQRDALRITHRSGRPV